VKSPTPTCDEPPDLYVCLDTTKPEVELLPPVSESPGVIKLRWKATDANLEESPIRLEFSIGGETWSPVQADSDWLPNTGEYLWTIPKGLPPELHLHVMARDKAGNIGESRSQSKYPIDLTVPEGRISGFIENLPEPRTARLEYQIPSSIVPAQFSEPSTYPEEPRVLPTLQREWPAMNRIEDPELLPMPRIFRACAEERERSTGVLEGREEEP
jgi:hypothetical protein